MSKFVTPVLLNDGNGIYIHLSTFDGTSSKITKERILTVDGSNISNIINDWDFKGSCYFCENKLIANDDNTISIHCDKQTYTLSAFETHKFKLLCELLYSSPDNVIKIWVK